MDEKKFSINTEQRDDIVILTINGYLDAYTSIFLEKKVEQSIEQNEYKFIFDFSNLDYISSAGLGVFMIFVEKVRENGGDIIMAQMNSKIATVFNLLGFNEIFSVASNVNEAINLFKR